MQQHGSKYFACRHTLDPGVGVKRLKHVSLKVVMMHIKLKGMEHKASFAGTYSVLTQTLGPWAGSTGQIIFSSESCRVAYQIKGNRAPHKHVFCTYTHNQPQEFGLKVKLFF